MADETTSSTEDTQDAGPAAGVKSRQQRATGKAAAAKKVEPTGDSEQVAGDADIETGADAGREGEDDPRDPRHPGNTQDREVSRAAGIHPFTVGGPETLHGSFLGNRTDAHKYVVAEEDGYLGFIPQYAQTPSTKKLWSAGQMVRKDFYEKWVGKAATQAHKATVLVDYNQPDHEPLSEAEMDQAADT
jgi:hypothetical protein